MLKRNQTISNQAGAFSELSEQFAIGSQSFERIARESVRAAGHLQLLFWLQGEFQRSVPHQIFIAAWGDLSSGLMQYDLVSAIPSVRTDNLTLQDLGPLIDGLFSKWVENGATPIGACFENGLRLGFEAEEREELKAFQTMQSALVHGIRDARGEEDCLYVFLGADPVVARSCLENLRVLLPFVDAASRRVANLPGQIQEVPQLAASEGQTAIALSGRELEIMHWVTLGKTNVEIGMILNISVFTVKNHLQRIFRRLNVSNRAQATSIVQQHAESREQPPVVDGPRNESPATAISRPSSDERQPACLLQRLPGFAFVVQPQ
ncbi:MAG: transcriptional regulator EpsA [Sulfuritalea sp.]|nr:transcriptional regulator EpsA [Sulfuritalea sp.]